MANTKVAPAVEMRKITKKFGDFVANENVDLIVEKGEVHALLGENGAGKSTLMNSLYGLFEPTSGEIFIHGEKVRISDPNVAIAHGLGMVHQHFMLIDTFTVAENIVLGMETVKGIKLDMASAIEKIKVISDKYGLLIDPNQKVQDISVGMQQRVEIIKALYRGADILILDEPTAVLTPQEIDDLIGIVKNLTDQGKTVIIITHKLKEIKAMADYCTVIRRGRKIETVKVSDVTEEDLAKAMVGREVNFVVDKEPREKGRKVLDIVSLTVKNNRDLKAVDGLNLELYEGEILGIAGIDGNGQSELIEALTGLRLVEEGQIFLNGKDVANWPVKDIQDAGMYSIPEDRQKRGLVLDFDISENLILENYYKEPYSKKGRLDYKAMNEHAKELIEKFDIRPPKPERLARELSGGNQQKVIIAREVTNDPDVLIAAQPTRGLDVGAIEYVHKYLVKQRDKNKAVLLISFELDEILSVSDRIAVIFDGKIVDVVDADKTDERRLGYLMAGGDPNEKTE